MAGADAKMVVWLTARDMSAKGFTSFKRSVAAVTRSVASLQGGLAALGVALTVSELVEAGREMASLEKSFTTITGSSQAMREEFDFVREVADDMGQNFYALVPSYKSLLAASKDTNLEGEATRDIFESITGAAANLGLKSDETTGALKAIEQMMSKGNVQAEELRGQLGERLPGAFNLAAEAMGVTTSELNNMLDRGEVLAEDLLPKLASVLKSKYSGGVDKATAASNKFDEAWKDLKTSMANDDFMNAISDSMLDISEMFKDQEFREALSEFTAMITTLAKGAGYAAEFATGTAALYNDILNISKAYREYAEAYTDFIDSIKGNNPYHKKEKYRGALATGGYDDFEAVEAAYNQASNIITRKDGLFGGVQDVKNLVIEYTTAWNALGKQTKLTDLYGDSYFKDLQTELTQATASVLELNDELSLIGQTTSVKDIWEEIDNDVDKSLENAFDTLDDLEAELTESIKNSMAEIQELVDDFKYEVESEFSGFFKDALTGEMDDFADYWESFWESMASVMADKLAEESANFLFETDDDSLWGLLSKLFNIGSSSTSSDSIASKYFDDYAGFSAINSMDSGGYLGEGVRGIGLKTGQSYEFHPDEFVIPASNISSQSSTQQVNYSAHVSVSIQAIDTQTGMDLVDQQSEYIANRMIEELDKNHGLRTAMREVTH